MDFTPRAARGNYLNRDAIQGWGIVTALTIVDGSLFSPRCISASSDRATSDTQDLAVMDGNWMGQGLGARGDKGRGGEKPTRSRDSGTGGGLCHCVGLQLITTITTMGPFLYAFRVL